MDRGYVSRQVFPERAPSIVSENLKRLQDDLLIQRVFDSSLQRKNNFYYHICENGIEVLKKCYPTEIIGNPKRSYAINHDLGLTDLREKLEQKTSVKRYITENMLNFSGGICDDEKFKPYIDLQSDAVLGLNINGETLFGALEYEPSAKNLDRYRRKIKDYYLRKEIRFVLYVCTSESTIKAIRQIEDELKPEGKTKLYFSLFDDVMKCTEVLTFQGRRESFLSIK